MTGGEPMSGGDPATGGEPMSGGDAVSGGDPLEALRAAWRRLDDAPEGGAADPVTREVVGWMRAVWSRVEPEPAALPRRLAPREHRSAFARWRTPIATAAAAGLLVAGGIWNAHWAAGRRTASLADSGRLAQAPAGTAAPSVAVPAGADRSVASPSHVAQGPGPDSREGPTGPRGPGESSPARPRPITSGPVPQRLVAFVGHDRMELRSGPVRFVLLTTPGMEVRPGVMESED